MTDRELMIDCPRCGHCCPQRPWVGLTDEEVDALQDFAYADDVEFIRNVENKLKEKNNG